MKLSDILLQDGYTRERITILPGKVLHQITIKFDTEGVSVDNDLEGIVDIREGKKGFFRDVNTGEII